MSSLLLRKSLKDCCRTCLNDLSNKMHGLFDKKNESHSVAEILSLFTNIIVQSEDMLPKNLCSSCYNCLINFYDFKKTAERVDFQLHQYYDNLITTDGTCKSVEVPVKNEFTESDDDPVTKLNLKEIKAEENSQDSNETCFTNRLEISFPADYNIGIKKSVKKPKKGTKINIYNCPDCLKTFLVRDKYEKHILIHKQEQNCNTESVKCDICLASFRSSFSLAAHKRKHVPKGRILSCQICSKIFKKTSHLKRHEASHDVNRSYKCSLCPKAYHLESQLTEHMHKHNGIKPHPCPICPKAFAHLSTLNTHLKLHTRGKPFLCPTCGKCFDSSTNMTQHVKRHLGLKQFTCHLCPGKFISRGELKSHINTHTGEKSHRCEHCPATFTASHSLKKHVLKHLGLKPFQCDKCPMKFTTKEYLSNHYRTHTGEKPYRCDLCERAFTQSGDLLKHKRVHLGVNLYKCDQCAQSFRLKSQLRDHVSDHYVSAMKAQDSKHTHEHKAEPKLLVHCSLRKCRVISVVT